MKNPFKKKHTRTNTTSQQRQPPTPPAVVKLTAADLERVQGGLKLEGVEGESQDDKKKNHIW